MEIERTYHDTWAIPPSCSVCGEPRVDGKPYRASLTLDKQTKWSGASAEITTQMASIAFPRCAKCVKAISVHDNAQGIGGTIALIFGIVGISAGYQLGGGWLWGCATGLLVLIALSFALMTGLERLMGRSFDEDMWRRTKLSSTPVTIKKVRGGAFAPEIKFTFASDEYGESFSQMNP